MNLSKLKYYIPGLLTVLMCPCVESGVYSINIQTAQGIHRFVEQSIPTGTRVINISHGGVLDPYTSKIKWGPLDPSNPLSLSFTLAAETTEQNLPHTAFPIEILSTESVLFEKDSDGDGVTDRWEHLLGSPTDQAIPGWDTDGDGLTDLEEILASTDPNDAQSLIAIKTFRVDESGLVQLTISLPENKTAIIETTHDLLEPVHWKQQSGIWSKSPDASSSIFTFEPSSWLGLEFIRARITLAP